MSAHKISINEAHRDRKPKQYQGLSESKLLMPSGAFIPDKAGKVDEIVEYIRHVQVIAIIAPVFIHSLV